MPDTLRVAAAQIESIPNDIAANLRKHHDMIDAARAAGVDVLVFPELSLTGHGSGRAASRLAFTRDHAHVAALARASGDMLTLFGAIERNNERFYNAVFAVRTGALVHVHRKINLATYGKLDDGKHFVNGTRIDTFHAHAGDDIWRAAAMICADTWNPPLVHLAAVQGATLMLVAVSSALEAVGGDFDNPCGWDINLRFHALTYGMPIVMANRVGVEEDLTFWGGSRVVNPHGHVEAEATSRDEQLVQAVIDIEDVRRARALLPTVRDANLPLLGSETMRLLSRHDRL